MKTAVSIHEVPEIQTESDEVERRETVRLVRNCLKTLSSHDRDAVLAWAHASDESCRDVAKRYGTCHQTTYNRARRALAELKTQLEVCL